MGAFLGDAKLDGQQRLRAVEGLDLGFLVDERGMSANKRAKVDIDISGCSADI